MVVVVGLACEIAATVLGTLGKQLVSYSGKPDAKGHASLFKAGGLTVTSVFGPLLDASAYALAPQSMVAPLNGLDIVWNTCLAPCTLGEHLTRSHVVGAALVFLGSSLSSCFGNPQNGASSLEREYELFSSCGFVLYCAAGAALLLSSALVLRSRPKGVGDWLRGVALGATAGFIAGNMFFLSEALGMLRTCLETGDWNVWRHWLPYVVSGSALAVALTNIPFMAKALEEYDALFMITLFAGCQIATACISAQVVLREMEDQPWSRTIAYWCCILLIICGLGVVGWKAKLLNAAADDLLREAEAGAEAEAAEEEGLPASHSVIWAGSLSGIGLYSGLASDGSGSDGESSSAPGHAEAAG